MAMINSLIAEIGKKFVLGAKSSAFIAEAVRAMLIGAGVPAEILTLRAMAATMSSSLDAIWEKRACPLSLGLSSA